MSSAQGMWLDFGALDELLCTALELEPGARDAYARSACAGDPVRLAALLQLLAQLDDQQAPWQQVAQNYARTSDQTSFPGAHERQTGRIANWTIVGLLGSGGMGDVYLAHRNVEGAIQRGALKLLASDRNSPELRARFSRERRILASLGDPRIARFYDAGILDDGRPWLAMEYVDGEQIDRWCDLRKANLRARVGLLIEVAQAVASAHSRLVVHRDIKPANVLVGSDGSPRLLDFGIAKDLGDDDSESPGLTRTQQRLMTPHFASPEQILGEPVGTASDIYQLGLLLYLLCCDRRPFQNEETSLPQFLQAISGRDAPSLVRALDSGGDLQSIAAARSCTVRQLRHGLRGDLRLIAAKALHREPAARYGSAAEFADDLALYLRGQPVRAAPPTLRYRAQRLISRHRLGSAMAIALLVAIAGGVGATVWQAREAITQRDQAQAEARKSTRLIDFLVGVFSQANPGRTQGAEVSAKSLLDAAVLRIETELPHRDAARSDLLAAMASAYGGLGLRPQRLALAQQALSIERQLQRPQVLTRQIVLAATALRDDGQITEALELLREAESRIREDPAESPGYLGMVMFHQAMAYFSLRDMARSEHRLEQALAQLRGANDARTEDIEHVLLMLSRRWASNNKLDQALLLVEELVSKIRAAIPARPADLVGALDALGSAYGKAGRTAEQVATYHEALALAIEVYGDEHFDVAVMHHNLALALESAADWSAALEQISRAVEVGDLSVDLTHNFAISARIAQIRLRCENGEKRGSTDELAALQSSAARFPQLAQRLAATAARCSR